MKSRAVAFSPAARDDLRNIHDWIADAGSPLNALRYVERIVRFCQNLDLASERGQQRDDVRLGLRIVGFERRVTIAFVVEADVVQIVRIRHAGANWESET